MKFLYEYRTSDNVKHDGVINAADKDAAFAALRSKGIRASRMTEAPGLCNKLFGKGKRWMAIGVLAAVALSALVVLNRQRRDLANETSPMFRHQIYGEPALMAALARDDYATVFNHPGDRFLARFAQPGAVVAALPVADRKKIAEELESVCRGRVEIEASDAREIAELKRIVNWMHGELENYLSNGVGSSETYINRLYARQAYEASVYNRAKADLKNEKDLARFDQINFSLRNVGLPTIAPPNFSAEK